MPSSPPLGSSSLTASASPSSDDSIAEELSFDYIWDEKGDFVRVSKESHRSSAQSAVSSPPTDREDDDDGFKSPSPLAPMRFAPAKPLTLTRSESAFPVVDNGVSSVSITSARSFQRVASVPVSLAFNVKSGRDLPDDAHNDEKENVLDADIEYQPSGMAVSAGGVRAPSLSRKGSGASISRETHATRYRDGYAAGAPSISAGRPLADVPVPQRRLQAVRTKRLGGGPPLRASEMEGRYGGEEETDNDDDEPPPHESPHQNRPSSPLSQSGSRARRRASLSDATADANSHHIHGHYGAASQPLYQGSLRPGTSLGINEDHRQNYDDGRDVPPIRSTAALRLGHRRRDSDTLRSGAPYSMNGSPTLAEVPSRSSSGRGLTASSSAGSATLAAMSHRRSTTAPDTPSAVSPVPTRGGDITEKDRGHRSTRPAPLPPAPAAATAASNGNLTLGRPIVVNKKTYIRLDMIGKGGSSRVYRVMNSANALYAIKRVSLERTDNDTMAGYMNEISLLRRLEGNSRIIRLIDSETKEGPTGGKGHLLMVMECGEIDLAKLLQEQQKEPINMVWISYYWQQMLQAVHVIHEEKIVHSDLKPANFVLVKGQLKLIDFGIANAIANDTTNIQRDHQIGTVNYMSPEAIELPEGMRRLKVGRPSDVWSLGCILYQMVYGQPPFQHLNVYQKMRAIPNVDHVIDFPEYSTPSIPPASRSSNGSNGSGSTTPPKKLEHLKKRVRRDVIETMQSCLRRNPKERSTIPELLEQSWLASSEREPEPPAMPPPPSPSTLREMLGDDETIINPHYMSQLLQYGMRLGEGGRNVDRSPEALMREAKRLVHELKGIQGVVEDF